MKTITKIFVAAVALFGVAIAANAKSPKNADNNVSSVAERDIEMYGSNYTDGDKFNGLTRKVGFDRMIPPHALEVCFEKTTHIIFPSEVVYVDLGNENLVAGLADGSRLIQPSPAASTMTMPGAGLWTRLTKPVTEYMTHRVSMKVTKTLTISSVASVFVPDFGLRQTNYNTDGHQGKAHILSAHDDCPLL